MADSIDNPLTNTSFDVSLDSFEGPLSLLLVLAQKQKIDLTLLSLREIASQYIAFISKHSSLEQSANYLRMASYLAWLKSRRLLPQIDDEEDLLITTEEQHLLERLQHLKAMRDAGEKLETLPQLGIHFWPKGENVEETTSPLQNETDVNLDLTALLQSYGRIFAEKVNLPLQIWKSQILDMDAVLTTVKEKLIRKKSWIDMCTLIPALPSATHLIVAKSSVSATLMTILFLSQQGRVSIRQHTNFSPIYVKHEDLSF